MEAYFEHFPASAPEEDQEDRSVLYCLQAAHHGWSKEVG